MAIFWPYFSLLAQHLRHWENIVLPVINAETTSCTQSVVICWFYVWEFSNDSRNTKRWPNAALMRGTWRNGYSVALCQCRCLLWGFEPRLVQDFQRNITFLPYYWGILSMLCPWAKYFTLICFTSCKCTWQDRDDNVYDKLAAGLYALRGVEWTDPVTRG